MIPEFPEFKKLELADKDEIENFTKQFPPYSDFNFVSMWSWDIKGDMRVAWLNGNLVVKFTDYLTSQPFYSFLGTNKVNDTAAALIEISKVLGQKASIGLIPEVTAQLLDPEEFVVLEDRDQFDYIFDLKVVASLEGSSFGRKRTHMRKFMLNSGVRLEKHSVTDEGVMSNIRSVSNLWVQVKSGDNPNFESEKEIKALERFLLSGLKKDLIVVLIFIGDTAVGYSVSEKIHGVYAISHFSKADYSYDGIYEYLAQSTAKELLNFDCIYLNFEQDLGIQGLRKNKQSFSTGIFLKKYSVMLK